MLSISEMVHEEKKNRRNGNLESSIRGSDIPAT